MNARGVNGDTAFTAAWSWARDSKRQLTEVERTAAAECARLLARSGKVQPGAADGQDKQLWRAAFTGGPW